MRKALLIIFALLALTANAWATDVTVSSQVATNMPFNPANVGSNQSITVSVTNGSNTVTSSAAFPSSIVGRSGFTVAIGGSQYTVAGVASASSLTLTTAYGSSTGSATMTLYKFVILRVYSNQTFTTYSSNPTTATVSVTNGSATVTSSAAFPSALVGAVGTFPVLINNVRYQVFYVASTSSLVLTSPYTGSTGSTTIAFNAVSDVVQQGAVGSAGFYKEIAVSIINPGAGNLLYYPSFILPATTDAPVNNTARYTLAFYNASGGYLNANYSCDGGVTQLALPPTTPTSFQSWCAYSGATNILPDSSTYTRAQIDARFPACSSGQSYYFAANGNIVSCLNFGSGLTLVGNTLTATGGGSVTSVGLSLPSIFSVSGSPVTTSGTLTGALASQSANTVFAGPTSGGSAAPTFRALVRADMPPDISINTADYGAVCNGVANDTTAIANAIAAAQSGSKILNIQPGTCLTDPITANLQKLIIRGAGRGKSTLKARVANNPVFNITGAGYASGMVLQDLTIQGQGKTSGSSGHCIYINDLVGYLAESNFQRLEIKDCGGKGIYIPTVFITTFDTISTDEIGDNHYEIAAGNTVTFINNYIHTVEANKVGFRITGGQANFISNTGMDPDSDLTARWALLGAELAQDGFDSYFRGTLYGNNIEDFGEVGIELKIGSYASFTGNAFTTARTGNHVAVKFRFVEDVIGFWDTASNRLNPPSAGAWSNSWPIHSWNPPFFVWGQDSQLTTYYDTAATATRPLPYASGQFDATESKTPFSSPYLRATQLLKVGTASTTTGQIKFANATNSNLLTFQAGATASNLTFTFPTTDSTGTQCLSSNGSGTLGWSACSGGSGSGSVTSVSVVSANGFAGSVANATTTPAITLTTSITGILQGNGTAISAATTTGSGSVVLATSPTLVTPNLGTPSAVTLTNATGLPVATGISGLGTGVATALAVNTGSAGAFVLFNGAGGTPSSLTLTNATGLPISTGVSGLGTGIATFLATPSSANLAAAVTDETGSGSLVFGTSPTLTTPNIGAATATSINGLTITSSTGTLTVANGKTATISNTLTLAGTDSTTMTFPGTSDTIAGVGTTNTFTVQQTITGGTTSGADRLLMTVTALATNGVRISPNLIWRGSAYDGSAHTVDWRARGTPTANDGTSQWDLQSRIDGNSFATRLSVADDGTLTIGGGMLAGSGSVAVIDSTGNLQVSGFAAASLSGNGGKLATTTGTLTSGRCVEIDANGNFVQASGACGIAGAGYTTVQEEGSNLTARTTLNFVGSSATAADDAGNSRTNVTFDSDLNALASNSTTGLWAITGSGSGAARTITGTSGTISVSNGDGVSGNPTLTIDAAYVGQTSITTLGTITTGTWNGTTIAVARGGTGATTLTGLVKGNGTSAFTAAVAGTDYVAPGAVTTSGLTMATARILGRSTASTGAIEEITVGSGLSLSGGTLSATGGTGTVTSFSAGNLSPLFTTSVATATTTPALSFSLSNAAANTYFGNATGSTAAPSFTAAGALTKTDDTNVTLTLGGSPTTALLTAASITVGWTGTLAAGRLNSNVVQAVTNDTNITGSISAQTLTLGFTGTLAKARQNAATVYNDAANTWSAGAQSFASATSLTVPTSAGASPTTSAQVAYDSTSHTLEYGANGTNRVVANLDEAQTLSNKTLTTPTIASFANANHTHTNSAGGGQLTDAALSSAVTVAKGGTGLTSGTSGGIPYFSGTTTIASSGALTANLPVIGGGGGGAPTVGARSGNTTTFVTSTGTLTSGRCAEWDASGNLVQSSGACGGGAPAWSSITNPSGAGLSLSMAAFATTFTWNATTSTTNLFNLTDTTGNTGTGYVLTTATASGSAAKPFRFTAGGTSNGVEMNTSGVISALGTGGIDPAALVTTAGVVPDGALSINVPLLDSINTFTNTQTFSVNDSATNAVTNLFDIQHSSTGSTTTNFGTGIRFGLESANGTTNRDAGRLNVQWSTATDASRTAKMVVQLVNGGAAMADKATFDGNGNLTVTGVYIAGSAPTTLTDSTGKILSAALNTVGVAQGGTGATTLTGILKGNGTSAFTSATAGTDYTTSSSTETFTNKTIDTEGTGNVVTISSKIWIDAAANNAGTAAANWDLPSSNAPSAAAITGTNVLQGVLDFADGSSDLTAQRTMQLPSDWTGNVDIRFRWFSSTTSGDVIWGVSTACVANAETNDPSFNSYNDVTDTTQGTTNQMNEATISNITMTGCAAGEILHLRIARRLSQAGDTMAGTARLVGLELTLRRAL